MRSQGISAHTDELLRNMEFIREAQSKGLVVFCWGDYNNDHGNRMKLREHGVDGVIYDRWALNLSCCTREHSVPRLLIQQQSLVGLRILIKCLLASHIDII